MRAERIAELRRPLPDCLDLVIGQRALAGLRLLRRSDPRGWVGGQFVLGYRPVQHGPENAKHVVGRGCTPEAALGPFLVSLHGALFDGFTVARLFLTLLGHGVVAGLRLRDHLQSARAGVCEREGWVGPERHPRLSAADAEKHGP